MQLMEEINHDQTQELENMIRELESENATLQEEYAHLKANTTSSSGTTTSGVSSLTFTSGSPLSSTTIMNGIAPNTILNEAKLLREHKGKLESRMKVLEEHNQQLISQLGKLKRYLGPVKTTSSLCDISLPGPSMNKTGTLNIKSVTASQLAMDSPILPPKMNGHYVNHQSLGLNSVRDDGGPSDPPALPPRSAPHLRLHSDSVTTVKTAPMQPFPPAVPPKRSSLTKSELFLHPDKVKNALCYSMNHKYPTSNEEYKFIWVNELNT